MNLSAKLVKPFIKILNKMLQSTQISRAEYKNYREILESEIVKHKRIENALRGSEEKYRAILDLSPELILLLDKEGNILDANEKLHKWLGYRLEEVIGRSLLELFSRQVYDLGEPPGEIDFFSRSGVKRTGRMFSTMIGDESGEAQSLVMIMDVTERKRAAEALQEIASREAQAYAQGRLEIIETILHNIGNAIGSVSIGIGAIRESLANNRLTCHLLLLAKEMKEHQGDLADYIRDDPQGRKFAPLTIALADDFARQDEKLVKTVSRAYEKAERISALIRMEKATDGESVYRKDINPAKAIDNAITALHDSISERNIIINVDCGCAPKKINIQEGQFHQMLMDLIENSIEAIDYLEALKRLRDEPFIGIECRAESDSFILDITDNGIGIGRDKLNTIFRSSYTAGAARSRSGLPSAANFVKRCGGQILVSCDDIDTNTTIRIILPI